MLSITQKLGIGLGALALLPLLTAPAPAHGASRPCDVTGPSMGVYQSSPASPQSGVPYPNPLDSYGDQLVSLNAATYYMGQTPLTVTVASGSDATSGATTIVAATSGKAIHVLQFTCSFSGAVNVNLQSHVTTSDASLKVYGALNTSFPGPYVPLGWFATVSGEALDLNLSAATAAAWQVIYVVY
jgi:hypothetical protein